MPMAFVHVIAMGSEVVGDCEAGIRIEVGEKMIELVLVCHGFFGEALSTWKGLSLRCTDGGGARYWRLIYWLMGALRRNKKPLHLQGL